MEVMIENVSKSFRNGQKTLPVLEDINLELHKEEFVALVGPSGCGKSMTLKCIAGIVTPDRRRIRLFHRRRCKKRTPGLHRFPGNRTHALAECV